MGNLTDTSGVSTDIGITISHGIQIWADDVNSDGGTCGPHVKIDNRDTGYHADKVATLYAAMNADVTGKV